MTTDLESPLSVVYEFFFSFEKRNSVGLVHVNRTYMCQARLLNIFSRRMPLIEEANYVIN